jgi:uncharacterized protein YneF (UPF0154 family)
VASKDEQTSDVEIVEETYAEPPAVETPSKIISGVMGLLGFATAALVGLWAGNPGVMILWRALLAMVVCSLLGRVLGYVGYVCVREFLDNYKDENPIPEMPESLKRLYKQDEEDRLDQEIMRKTAA